MLGYYNYTVILTYFGAAIGFVGTGFVLNGNPKAALTCLMVSGFCDMFDGKIAATKKRTQEEKAFGIQIDSLSDLLCFGILPALIVSSLLPRTVFSVICCSVYVLCALIRLAFFNVDEAQRQAITEESRTIYRGLPVTSAALLFPFVFVLTDLLKLPVGAFSVGTLLLTAAAFITPFSLKKPAKAGKAALLLIGIGTLIGLLLRGF